MTSTHGGVECHRDLAGATRRDRAQSGPGGAAPPTARLAARHDGRGAGRRATDQARPPLAGPARRVPRHPPARTSTTSSSVPAGSSPSAPRTTRAPGSGVDRDAMLIDGRLVPDVYGTVGTRPRGPNGCCRRRAGSPSRHRTDRPRGRRRHRDPRASGRRPRSASTPRFAPASPRTGPRIPTCARRSSSPVFAGVALARGAGTFPALADAPLDDIVALPTELFAMGS